MEKQEKKKLNRSLIVFLASCLSSLLFLVTHLAFSVKESDAQQAEGSGSIYLDSFSGLNNFLESSKIDQTEAQSLNNVLTDSGYLEKRPGNLRVGTGLSGYPIKYLKEFIAPSGTKYLIYQTSTTIYQTSFAGSAVALATVSAVTIVDSVSAFGRHYISRGTADPIMYWDASSTATISGAPNCTYLEFADERLYCANTNASSSRVSISSFGFDNGWSVPAILTPDSPNSVTFQREDGEPITCFASTPWGKFIGKRHSTHILKGFDNNTYYKRIIDPTIGCIDDRSVQMIEGTLVWLAVDGIYGWDGASPPRIISKDIESTVLAIRQLNSQLDTFNEDTQADWQRGDAQKNGVSNSWDMASIPGSIFPSTVSFLDTSSADFSSGTLVDISTWNYQGAITLIISSVTPAKANGTTSFEDASLAEWTAVGTNWGIQASCTTGNWYGTQTAMVWDAPLASYFYRIKICDVNVSDVDCLTPTNSNEFLIDSELITDSLITTTATINLSSLNHNLLKVIVGFKHRVNLTWDKYLVSPSFARGKSITYKARRVTDVIPAIQNAVFVDFELTQSYSSSGTFISRSFDSTFSTPTWGPFDGVVYTTGTGTSATFQTQVSSDDATWDSLVSITTGSKPTSAGKQYMRYKATLQTTVSTNTPRIDQITMAAVSTGVYHSEVRNIGTDITSWRTGDFSEQSVPSGRLSYSVRASTAQFSVNSSTPTWTAHTNHNTLTISTGSYVQFRVISSVDSTTETARLDLATIRWQEGTEKPVASGVKDRRYFLSVTTSPSNVDNDTVLVLQKNNKWTTFSGPSYYSMNLYDNNLYAGDSSTNSYIWKTMQSGVYADDGLSIKSHWVTKDFTVGYPMQKKALRDIWFEAAYTTGTTLTIGYAANRSESFINKSYDLGTSTFSINARVPVVDGFALGKYFKFKISNESIDQNYKIYAITGYYDLQPLRFDDNE